MLACVAVVIFGGSMYPLKNCALYIWLRGYMSCTLKNMSGSPGSIQYCAVSYNTSCKLTLQLNSDKYDVFYDLII